MAQLQKVEFGDKLPGYEAGSKTSPGVIVIQEWWGVDEDLRQQALYLASKNYRTLAVDLYKGKLTLKQEEANHVRVCVSMRSTKTVHAQLMSNLDFPNAVQEIKQAVGASDCAYDVNTSFSYRRVPEEHWLPKGASRESVAPVERLGRWAWLAFAWAARSLWQLQSMPGWMRRLRSTARQQRRSARRKTSKSRCRVTLGGTDVNKY